MVAVFERLVLFFFLPTFPITEGFSSFSREHGHAILQPSPINGFSKPQNQNLGVQRKRLSPLVFATLESTANAEEYEVTAAVTGDKDAKEEDVSVMDIVHLVEGSPSGTLQQDEILLLREIMESLGSEGTGDPSAAETIERLFLRMLEEWKADLDGDQLEKLQLLEPTSSDFLTAIHAWENVLSGEARAEVRTANSMPQVVQHVSSLFDIYEDLLTAKVQSIDADLDIFNAVLRVLGSSRERMIDRKVNDIFDRMQQNYGVEPSPLSYHYVVVSLAKSRGNGAANRAEKVLREGLERFPPMYNSLGRCAGISIDTCNVVLTAWAKSSVDYGPERAEKLIVLMDQLDTEHGGYGLLRPNVRSLTSLIDAYAQVKDWESVSNAEQILNRVLTQYLEEGEKDLEPNVASWTIVIGAWSKLSKKGYKGAAARAGRLLHRMESLHEDGKITFAPDAIVYITVMNAYAAAKTLEGSEKATEVLNEMNERFLDGDDSMQPSLRSIRLVLESWTKISSPGSMSQAEQVLDKFEEQLELLAEESDEGLQGVSDIFRIMLFGWARAGDPIRAQNYLLDMIDRKMKLDSFSFDRVIESNTASGDENAMKRTHAIFELLEECRQRGDVKPNERVFTSFIRAMTKARINGIAPKAQMVLKRIEALYADGNKGMEPTVFTYNAVIMACAEETSTDSAAKLNAFKVALSTFNTIRNHREGPDHVSFGNMLRCSCLLPEGQQRDKLVQSTFQLCCKRGFVNAFVLRDLQQCTTEEYWRKILDCPHGSVDIESIPHEWRNRFDRPKERPKEARSYRKKY